MGILRRLFSHKNEHYEQELSNSSALRKYLFSNSLSESRIIIESFPKKSFGSIVAEFEMLCSFAGSNPSFDKRAIDSKRKLLARCQEIGIEKAFAELTNSPIDSFLFRRVMEFLYCEIENSEVIIGMEPLLLSEDADEIFIRIIDGLQKSGDEFKRKKVEEKHAFIRRCREIGIENAFREIDDNKNKKSAKDLYNSGNTKYYNHDYKGAIVDYTKALMIIPNFEDAYNNRANAKEELQDYNGAIDDSTKAIEINPMLISAYYNRAIAKKKLHDFVGAIADYSKVIEIDPNDAEAYYNRGLLEIELDQKESGSMDLRKAKEMGFNLA